MLFTLEKMEKFCCKTHNGNEFDRRNGKQRLSCYGEIVQTKEYSFTKIMLSFYRK